MLIYADKSSRITFSLKMMAKNNIPQKLIARLISCSIKAQRLNP